MRNAVILLLCALSAGCSPFVITPTNLPPDLVVTQLMSERAEFAGLRNAQGQLHCVSIMEEARTAKDAEIVVREVHRAPECPGDPATSPVIERFRVPLTSGPILRYDAAQDLYRPMPPR